jgi:hypothetical protein
LSVPTMMLQQTATSEHDRTKAVVHTLSSVWRDCARSSARRESNPNQHPRLVPLQKQFNRKKNALLGLTVVAANDPSASCTERCSRPKPRTITVNSNTAPLQTTPRSNSEHCECSLRKPHRKQSIPNKRSSMTTRVTVLAIKRSQVELL